MAVQRSIKVTKDDDAKGVSLAQLRQFVQETADLDPNAVPTAKVSMRAGLLVELEVKPTRCHSSRPALLLLALAFAPGRFLVAPDHGADHEVNQDHRDDLEPGGPVEAPHH